ncbi:hypothetical protein IL38_23780 [Actinopolyspora erythraea]|uniref:Uncharacterized protein n=1 Tax=Actinopolyspora erythraea TaxID=414996 RepID=A0ABR4WYN3_9ACTN|nr:hypothetical protein [Actinopolyspora erythraea]KGI79333.1 hypothetical protein IL38_23780 [Actinopolyspora erythraea]
MTPNHPGVPGRATTTADHTDPVLVVCALAGWGNPLLGVDATEPYVRKLLTSTLRTLSRQEILAWRRHYFVSEQNNRWNVAKRWAITLLGTPGAEDLPDDPSPDPSHYSGVAGMEVTDP